MAETVATSIFARRDAIFRIWESETDGCHWSQVENVRNLLQTHLDRAGDPLFDNNPVIQEKLVGGCGLYGRDKVNSHSGVIVALRYSRRTGGICNLRFVWKTCAHEKRQISLQLPKNGSWQRLEVPIPTIYQIFGDIRVHSVDAGTESTGMSSRQTPVELNDEEIAMLEGLTMTLTADQKDFLHGLA